MFLENIQSTIDEMMAQVPGHDTPTFYVLWGVDGKNTSSHYNEACHASLMNQKGGVYDELVTRTGPTTPQNQTYLQGLLNGPFKNFAQYVTLHDGYLHVQQLDKWPAKVLFNFCIATRLGMEYPSIVEKLDQADPIKDLVEKMSAGKSDFPFNFNSNHLFFSFEHGYWNQHPSDPGRILSGDMNIDPAASTYKQYPRYCRPCNTIWRK